MESRYGLTLMSDRERAEYYKREVEKKYTYLRGVCSDDKHPNLIVALGFAYERHRGQNRKSGEPYIDHPFTLACDAVGMGMNDDILLATLVLHDVLEDTPTIATDLPVNDDVKRAVECMTVRRLPGESKYDTKNRYYSMLARNKYAVIGKGLDRRNNLGTMAGIMPKVSIVKNCYETWFILLPLLGDAKTKWPEYSNQLHTIRTDIAALTKTLVVLTGTKLAYREWPSDELMRRILEAESDEDLARIAEIVQSPRLF
ncbi:hypothetical protein IKG10_00730 [Candidatus Saccharibacteria bacterium]|nr:hypothetical protein [Candidatus Saccharibacteria bacterium]